MSSIENKPTGKLENDALLIVVTDEGDKLIIFF